jgi:RNA polymerase sigma factor (sigma-70 family)
MKYETLATYRMIAQKAVKRLAPKFYTNLSTEILSNEEALGEIVNAIITADWKWDSERVGKESGQKKTLYSYRNQCVIWAIKTYITNKYKSASRVQSINRTKNNGDNSPFEEQVEDTKILEPIDLLIENEYHSNTNKLVTELFNSNILTNKQKEQIKLYYFHDLTLAQIGAKYGTTREAVRQNIKKGLETIGSVFNES